MKSKNHRVMAVVFDGVAIFELGIAIEVFGLPRPEFDDWYDFGVCAAESGKLSTQTGLKIDAPRKGLRSLASAGTIVVPSWRDVHEQPPGSLLGALRRAHERGARIVSFCSGAFVLAAAGLLDERKATTHWRYADALTSNYPQVSVDPNVLYVDDGDILTAAGSAAGIDLCLHLVRKDFGFAAANVVARRLVVLPHREGGQSQFIKEPITEHGDDVLAELMDWLRGNLKSPHSVSTMATHAHMTTRTFARRFLEQTGTTPGRWLTRERVKHAQHLLESTDLDMEQVAKCCGLGSAQLMRLHFQRQVGSAPTAYRRSFRLNR
ncbi:MAG: transcriptional regulator FtrA [Planctomycetota bacterium]